MTIPSFKKLYKIFPFSLCLILPFQILAIEQNRKISKPIGSAQSKEQNKINPQQNLVREKLMVWLGMLHNPERYTPVDLLAFFKSHAHWPYYDKLCKKAEGVIIKKATDQEILSWFENHPPQTPEGVIIYGKSLLSYNHTQKAMQIITYAWQTMSFTKMQEKEILTSFSPFIKTKHHMARLDFLLWNEQLEEASRLLARVPENNQKIAHIRIGYIKGKPNALHHSKAVSSQIKSDEGVLYEEAKWLRKQKRFEEAKSILLNASINSLNAQKWWKEQNYIAREFLGLGDYHSAYKIVKGHKLQVNLEEFAEAEWFAGWLALQFLNQSDDALKHFKLLSAHVKGVMSKSRGAYWIGRAYEKKMENKLAEKAYGEAAFYITTYYGQLAASKIKKKPYPILASDSQATKEERKKFEESELVKAVYILKSLGKQGEQELDNFLLHIARQAKTKAERELSVQLTHKLSPHQVVWAAKKAGFSEPVLLKIAFPTCTIPKKGQEVPETPLVLAIAKQESCFVPTARSTADARGLLQLIPATAAEEAKRLGIPHKDCQLFDPQHNLVLGSSHLSYLLKEFMGSYILVFAAYNAGPTPVRRWIKQFGDPRQGNVDIIDWIELIPYSETRNYVMRVLENVTNYRSLHSQPKVTLVDDLKR